MPSVSPFEIDPEMVALANVVALANGGCGGAPPGCVIRMHMAAAAAP
jgi:hypothetical protein